MKKSSLPGIVRWTLAVALLSILSFRTGDVPARNQRWTLISDDVLATVYNAVPSQCNDDCVHTASMFTLNLDDVLSHRIIAMERTMMSEYGLRYGDVVLISGAGPWDGIWQVQDTMNKRFAGQHRIDILVPRDIRHGKWENVRVSVPADEYTRMSVKARL